MTKINELKKTSFVFVLKKQETFLKHLLGTKNITNYDF